MSFRGDELWKFDLEDEMEDGGGSGKKKKHKFEDEGVGKKKRVEPDPYRKPKAEKKAKENGVGIDQLPVVELGELDPTQQEEVVEEAFADQDMEGAVRKCIEELNKKKKTEERVDVGLKKRNDLGPIKEEAVVETVWYDEAYQDLYTIMTGTGEEILEAEKRLKEHGIKRKEYSEDDVDNKQKYVDLLRKIVENDGSLEEIDELKGKIRSKHKSKKVVNNESSGLPDEFNGREKRLKEDGEMPYNYFSREDGLLKDLDTVYGNNAEVGAKRPAYENLRKYGLEGIKRGESDPKIDYGRGKRMIQLLREYISLSDNEAKKYQDREELFLLLKDSGLTKMELVDQARRKRVNGNIMVPENQLTREEKGLKVDNKLVLLVKHYCEEKRLVSEGQDTEELGKIERELENLGIDLTRSDLLKHPELYQQTKLWLLSDDMNGNDLRKEAEKVILEVLKLKEKTEKEGILLDKDLWKDFSLATQRKSNTPRLEAQQRIKDRGIDFDKAGKDKKEVQEELLKAINVVSLNHEVDRLSVDVAKKKLMDYFGVVEREEKKEEKTTVVDEKKKTKEKMAGLVREDLKGEDLKKFYRAINVIVDHVTDPDFENEDMAIEYFTSNIKTENRDEAPKRDILDDYLHAGGLLVFSDNKKEMKQNIKEARIRAILDDIYEAVTRKDEKARERLSAVGIKLLSKDINEEVLSALKTIEEVEGKLWGNFGSVEKAEEFLISAFKIDNALKTLVDHYREVGEKKEAFLRNRMEIALSNDNLKLLRNWTIAKEGTKGFNLAKIEEELRKKGFGLSMLGGSFVEDIREALNKIVLDKSERYKTKKAAQDRLMVFYKEEGLEEKEKEPEVKTEKVESRRMELGAMFAQYEKISMNKDLWKKWRARIEATEETSPEREYAIKQLQATIYLYNNPLERIKHYEYWRLTGMAIMRDLRAKEV